MSQTKAQKAAYQRKWYKKNRSVEARAKKTMPTSKELVHQPTIVPENDISRVVSAYKALDGHTASGKERNMLRWLFTNIVKRLG